jgi:hypothetical protein
MKHATRQPLAEGEFVDAKKRFEPEANLEFLDELFNASSKEEMLKLLKRGPEPEAMLGVLQFVMASALEQWPKVYKSFRETFGEAFKVEDEEIAAFDLALAALSQTHSPAHKKQIYGLAVSRPLA